MAVAASTFGLSLADAGDNSTVGYKDNSKGYSTVGYKDNSKKYKERGYISKNLPKWIDVDVELRHRFESRNDLDFDATSSDNDGINLGRTRVGVTLKPTDQLKLYYLFQDSRLWDTDTISSKSKYENWHDAKKLYVKYKNAFEFEPIGLKGASFIIGRQGLSYGKERLIGDPDWGNVGQAFDAFKGIFKFEDFQIDVFGGNTVDKKTPREFDDLYEGGSKDRLIGYYAMYHGFENVELEQYLLTRKTNKAKTFGPSASGELDEFTAGGRIYGPIGETGFDYEFEGAYQWGDMESLDISAWMTAAVLGYNIDHEWDPRVELAVDYASGDHDKSDDERNTFDNLYPNEHDRLGIMDRVSLQNVNHYGLSASAKPTDKLKLKSGLHWFYLDSQNDYLYDANRKKIRSTTGSAYSRYVGSEIDLIAKYALCEYADLEVGYSHFFAGSNLEDSGEEDDADFGYVQTTLKF